MFTSTKIFKFCAMLITIFFAEAVLAGEWPIKKNIVGAYGFTTSQTCTRSAPQAPGTVAIDPETRAFNVDAHVVDMSGSGEITFSKDGKFTLTGYTASELDKHNLFPGATPITSGFYPYCEGDYKITSKNTFETYFNCEIEVPSQGITIKAGPVVTEGYISKDGEMISMNLLQKIQTLTAFAGDSPVVEFQRMCLQTFTLLKSEKC